MMVTRSDGLTDEADGLIGINQRFNKTVNSCI